MNGDRQTLGGAAKGGARRLAVRRFGLPGHGDRHARNLTEVGFPNKVHRTINRYGAPHHVAARPAAP